MKVVISVEYFENGVYNVEILSILGRNQCLTDGVGNQRQIIVESVFFANMFLTLFPNVYNCRVTNVKV